jgi:uncharacterized membrane protein (DUF373 family)
MVSLLQKFEKAIVGVLVVMIALVILVSTADLGWMILKDISSPPFVLLGVGQLLDVFGLLLLVVIGVELLDIMKTYLVERAVRVEIVLEVAIVSVARKVLVLEVKEVSNLTLIALAALLAALAGALYLYMSRWSRGSGGRSALRDVPEASVRTGVGAL